MRIYELTDAAIKEACAKHQPSRGGNVRTEARIILTSKIVEELQSGAAPDFIKLVATYAAEAVIRPMSETEFKRRGGRI
jgi:hypothetical protein